MQSLHYKSIPVFLALLLGGAALPAHADDTCLDFKWDVSQERALFAGTPTAVTTGKDLASAPVVVPNRLYKLRLAPQDRVAFPATPAKKTPSSAAYAGLAVLKIAVPGSYRVAVDLPLWIDVVSQGALIQAADFQGQHACAAPHKIVVFDLAGVQPFMLQFSSAASDSILLTVTAAPIRKF
jgi:hypothetical protein